MKYKSIKFFMALILCVATLLSVSADALGEGGPKIIYLTFDDGPSFATCNKIMDILKEKEVKATFFVVGCRIQGREKILRRMHEEGHSIGLHTYTHDYKKIYASEDVFLKEMEDTASVIEGVIGSKPSIIRFPTGSKPHLNQVFLQKLHSNGYKIYDWNACVSDGLNYHTPSSLLYKQAIRTGSKWDTIFLLMHSDEKNANTCKALPDIIDYYKNLGYTFKVIEDTTPEYYFRVKK